MYTNYFGIAELPFSVTPDPRFSYTNTHYREAFANLRYGIETRKGFIVITGEAGTGKTTLLRRLMRGVESTVHTAFIFNTHLSFTELLRLALNELGVAGTAQDRLTLMAQLNDYLIEQLRKDHIVSLLIDEAQDLSDEMLEELRLLSNLETDRAKLIQIVLMGQPELERKLDQPHLRQLKQRVAVRCRLAPLRSDEVALYIHSRLQTVGYAGQELFDLESVEQIARYSQGIPRLINVICDNALLITYATSKSKVSAKIIDEVARDLQITVPPPQHRATEQRKEVSPPANSAEDWRANFEQFPAPPPRPLQPKRSWAGVGIGVMLTMVILSGTVLYSRQSGSLAALAVDLEELVGVSWKNPLQVQAQSAQKSPGEKALVEEKVNESYVQRPLLEGPNLPALNAAVDRAADASAENAVNSNVTEAKAVTENPGTSLNQTKTAKGRPQIETLYYYNHDAAVAAQKLEFEIYKAIHNRAIRGVEVSVRDGTVYLTGQVASEKQKLAATQAARSVSGVNEVRDQIAVNAFYHAGNSR
jgi:general secretion pathway protein A